MSIIPNKAIKNVEYKPNFFLKNLLTKFPSAVIVTR